MITMPACFFVKCLLPTFRHIYIYMLLYMHMYMYPIAIVIGGDPVLSAIVDY